MTGAGHLQQEVAIISHDFGWYIQTVPFTFGVDNGPFGVVAARVFQDFGGSLDPAVVWALPPRPGTLDWRPRYDGQGRFCEPGCWSLLARRCAEPGSKPFFNDIDLAVRKIHMNSELRMLLNKQINGWAQVQ